MPLRSKIQRLILYRLSILHFQASGCDHIFSHNIAREVGVSPEQVRKDFSDLKIRGNKKAGYAIEQILPVFNSLFQKEKEHNVILVGMGNIGMALSNFKGFQDNQIIIRAAFDINTRKQSSNLRIPVYPPAMIPKIIRELKVRIAILAVPWEAAQSMTDLLVDNGIKGIMNFTYVHLRVPEYVHVMYVSLSNTLESLVYLTSHN